jgi:hypothetical protein
VGQVFVASVFFRQHDRQHTGDDGLSVWVLDIWLLIQIDPKKDRLSVGVERAKVVLLVRVIGVAEIVKYGDCPGDASDRFGAQSGDTASHHSCAFAEILTQSII